MKLLMTKKEVEKEPEAWTSDMPLIFLPDYIQEAFKMQANLLYGDLEYNKLSVVLAAAPNQRFGGHMIRAVEKHNPEWYKKLCNQYDRPRPRRHKSSVRKRNPKTKSGETIGVIKRQHSLSALDRIRRGRDLEYVERRKGFVPSLGRYDMIYRDLIVGHLTEGFILEGFHVDSLEEVVNYFSGNRKK